MDIGALCAFPQCFGLSELAQLRIRFEAPARALMLRVRSEYVIYINAQALLALPMRTAMTAIATLSTPARQLLAARLRSLYLLNSPVLSAHCKLAWLHCTQ